MTYSVSQPSVGASVGAGIGKSLAELVPKEVERYRLSKGLQQLGQAENLSPFQQFAQLASIPGITPQMIESGTQLLRQQAKSQLANQGMPQNIPAIPKEPQDRKPTFSREEARREALNPTLPMTQDQLRQRALQIQQATGLPWDNSMAEAEKENASALQRSRALIGAHELQTIQEDKLKNYLAKEKARYKANIPAKVESDIESKAINSMLPIEEEGEGLSFEQASKKYGPMMDLAAKNYADVTTLSHKNPNDMIRRVDSLQKDFSKRDDTNNFANELITQLEISPGLAFSIAEPIDQVPELAKVMKKIPAIPPQTRLAADISGRRYFDDILKAMGTKGSPQAIAHEFEEKGYDPKAWLVYANENKEKMTPLQADQINKQTNILNGLNDYWFNFFKWWNKGK